MRLKRFLAHTFSISSSQAGFEPTGSPNLDQRRPEGVIRRCVLQDDVRNFRAAALARAKMPFPARANENRVFDDAAVTGLVMPVACHWGLSA